jgi:mannan endo-1,4-beta-mannosidase
VKSPLRIALVAALALAAAPLALPDDAPAPARPVTPDAMPEAVALLQLLHDISGKYTLSGQHNYPNTRSRNTEFASRYIGKTPVIWGSDWGHAKAGDTDSYLARPDIVQEAIRQHRLGSIIALCWHAVPPTADEPITFRALPGADPAHLKSVQGKLLDEQFRDLLTPGTALYDKWCAQVDTIAGYLRQLQDAHVPVLWRPYHEMNGDWFWWGGRTGQYSTMALYRQIFDRFVNHDHLRNLIWVWNVDRPTTPARQFSDYFPGINYVDVLALDAYGSDFAQSYYDSLAALSQGKPMALAEVGNPPRPEVLERQPRWTYYMTWAAMVRNTSRTDYAALMADPRVLNLEDPAYWTVTADYRRACGLPVLRIGPRPADFSGLWALNEDRSQLGSGMGVGMVPARLEIAEAGNDLTIKSTRVVEYADDQVTTDHYVLDGATETKSEFFNSPRLTTGHKTEDGRGLELDSTVNFSFGPPGSRMTTTEVWNLLDGGRALSIRRHSVSARGEQTMTMVYTKL